MTAMAAEIIGNDFHGHCRQSHIRLICTCANGQTRPVLQVALPFRFFRRDDIAGLQCRNASTCNAVNRVHKILKIGKGRGHSEKGA